MSLIAVECPKCGADLPPREPTENYTCDYCGTTFEPERVRRAHDEAGHALSTAQLAAAIVEAQKRLTGDRHPFTRPSPSTREDAHARRRLAPGLAPDARRQATRTLAIIAIVLLGTCAVPMGVSYYQHLDETGAFEAGKRAGSAGWLEPKIAWDDNGGPPLPVEIADLPAVIGRTRAADGSDVLFVDAYALDGSRRWRLDDLGTYANAYGFVRFAAAGAHLVVSDASATLRVARLADGAVEKRVALTDQIERLCTPLQPVDGTRADGVTQVWVEQVDDRSFLFDPASGELTAAGRPAWCPEDDWPSDDAHESVHPASAAPQVDGLRVLRAYVQGDLGVAAAVRHPGTAVPHAVGFDPSSLAVRWNEVVSHVSPNRTRPGDFGVLAGGRYVAVYGEGQVGWHLTALDAQRGSTLWDVTLRPLQTRDDVERMESTDRHVFLVRGAALEVYDASHGARLLTVGDVRFE